MHRPTQLKKNEKLKVLPSAETLPSSEPVLLLPARHLVQSARRFALLQYVDSAGKKYDVLKVKDGRVTVDEEGAVLMNAYWQHGALGAALTKAFMAQKQAVAVTITGIPGPDAQAIAAKLTGWTPTIPDPADPNKTITNTETALDAITRHLETMLIDVLKQARAELAEKAAGDAERKAVDDRLIGNKPKPTRARGNQ